MKEVEIEALRPFNKTAQGDICEVGDRFPVGETTADELERLGLAIRTGKTGTLPDMKAARAPTNKMAPEPANKRKPVKLAPEA